MTEQELQESQLQEHGPHGAEVLSCARRKTIAPEPTIRAWIEYEQERGRLPLFVRFSDDGSIRIAVPETPNAKNHVPVFIDGEPHGYQFARPTDAG